MYTAKIWTAKHNKNTQTSATLKCKSLCCKVLHRTGFTPEGAYTPKPLWSKSFFTQMFGPNDFYNRRCLHQRPFTPEAFYSRGTSHQRVFYARKFLQKLFTLGDFCNKICLRSAPITPNKHCASKSFYTKRL